MTAKYSAQISEISGKSISVQSYSEWFHTKSSKKNYFRALLVVKPAQADKFLCIVTLSQRSKEAMVEVPMKGR